jgi:hypothetical protein
MANLASNPWSFVQADVVTSTPTALSMGAGNIVSVTTSAAHGLSAGNRATLITPTNANYAGFYLVLTVPTSTTATLQPLSGTVFGQSGLAASSGGTLALNQYPFEIRAEDMQWEKPAPGESCGVYDKNGNPVWLISYPASSTAPNWNRGKPFWINGLTLTAVSAGGTGLLLVTVN